MAISQISKLGSIRYGDRGAPKNFRTAGAIAGNCHKVHAAIDTRWKPHRLAARVRNILP